MPRLLLNLLAIGLLTLATLTPLRSPCGPSCPCGCAAGGPCCCDSTTP